MKAETDVNQEEERTEGKNDRAARNESSSNLQSEKKEDK